MISRAGQRGVAMLAAIVLVSLATVLAVAIGFNTAMTARRGAGSLAVEQGLQLALGAEGLAAYVLQQDVKASAGGAAPAQTDTASDAWNQPFGPVEVVPGVALEAKLEDHQGRFNLNTLLTPNGEPDADQIAIFKMLLQLVEIEERWADLMVDWLDKDPSVYMDGGEDNLYTGLQPGYRTYSELITSPSELMQLPDFGRERYLRLLPHVTALPPEARTINVCLATPAVLDALVSAAEGSIDTTYTGMPAEDFAKQRAAGCFPDLQAIKSAAGKNPALLEPPGQSPRIGNTSAYFRLHTWITIGTTQFALYSLMQRQPQNGQVQTLLRTFGTE